jgi:hypothetical protein
MLEFFQRNGDLDLPHLGMIEDRYPTATHLLVVSLDRNRVSQNTSRYQYANNKKPKASAHYDQNGKLVVDNLEMKSDTVAATDMYQSIRDMAITIKIYDLVKGVTVWSGHVHKRHTTQSSQTNTYSANHRERMKQELAQAMAKGIVGGLTGTRNDNFPPPISTDDLLTELVGAFAQKLP